MISRSNHARTDPPREGSRRARTRVARRLGRLRAPLGRALRPLRRMLAALRNAPGPAHEIHVSWTDPPSRSLTFCWAGRARPGRARVQVRPAAGGPWLEFPASSAPRPASSGYLHTAIATNLEPGGRYAYRVSCDAGHATAWSECFTTRTAPEGARSRFEAVFFCDVGLPGRSDGTTDAAGDVIAVIRRSDPLVVLGGGDYAYANKDRRFLDPGDAVGAWLDAVQPLIARAPFMAQLGNHEVELVERAEDWLPRLPRPEGSPSGLSYAFDIGPAHIVGLHAPGRAPGPEELEWLEADLQGPAARRARWRIVYQHAPIIGHGRSHPARPELRSLMPSFDRLGVDLHLSGHDQSFERTHALRADGAITRPIPGEGPPTYSARAGVVYAKISPAGKLSDRGRGFSRLPAQSTPELAARSDAGHHFARLIVGPDELRVVVEQLRAPGQPVSTVDTFRLVHIEAPSTSERLPAAPVNDRTTR